MIETRANYTEWEVNPVSIVGHDAWTTCASCWAYEAKPVDDARPTSMRPDNQVAARITGPVLNIQVERDFFYEASEIPNQENYYPNADFELPCLRTPAPPGHGPLRLPPPQPGDGARGDRGVDGCPRVLSRPARNHPP